MTGGRIPEEQQMLTRIVVLGKDDKTLSSVTKAIDGERALVTRVGKAGQVPPGSAGTILGMGQIDNATEAALSLIAQHEEILGLLAMAIDCRDMAAEGSSARVQKCAQAFGRVLALKPEDQLTLERGALLRDIGKLLVPNDLLMKKGVLTFDEWETIRKHTHFGADMAAKTSALNDIEDIARRHHECFDGDGYPDGLEKDDIPFLARIVKILDVYCAMTSPRHYRTTVASHATAIEFLQEEKGKHFDPELVKAFVKGKVGAKK
jgi:putative nucleotidyltransferase with HDIG domain